MKEFTVKVDCGDVFINGEFVNQLCWNSDSIGMTVTNWLNDDYYTSNHMFDKTIIIARRPELGKDCFSVKSDIQEFGTMTTFKNGNDPNKKAMIALCEFFGFDPKRTLKFPDLDALLETEQKPDYDTNDSNLENE